jgi:serine/threonine protein kinase
LDSRSDLFTFGAILYEMATCRTPFDAAPSAASDRILNQRPISPARFNPQVPSELERIINKALETDPELRYQSAAELRTDLMQLKESGSFNAVEPIVGVLGQPWWLKKLSWLTAALALIALWVTALLLKP